MADQQATIAAGLVARGAAREHQSRPEGVRALPHGDVGEPEDHGDGPRHAGRGRRLRHRRHPALHRSAGGVARDRRRIGGARGADRRRRAPRRRRRRSASGAATRSRRPRSRRRAPCTRSSATARSCPRGFPDDAEHQGARAGHRADAGAPRSDDRPAAGQDPGQADRVRDRRRPARPRAPDPLRRGVRPHPRRHQAQPGPGHADRGRRRLAHSPPVDRGGAPDAALRRPFVPRTAATRRRFPQKRLPASTTPARRRAGPPRRRWTAGPIPDAPNSFADILDTKENDNERERQGRGEEARDRKRFRHGFCRQDGRQYPSLERRPGRDDGSAGYARNGVVDGRLHCDGSGVGAEFDAGVSNVEAARRRGGSEHGRRRRVGGSLQGRPAASEAGRDRAAALRASHTPPTRPEAAASSTADQAKAAASSAADQAKPYVDQAKATASAAADTVKETAADAGESAPPNGRGGSGEGRRGLRAGLAMGAREVRAGRRLGVR